MNKRFFSCLAACMLFCAGVSAQVFLIERGVETYTYADLKEAVDDLQDGDKLYIPAGRHSLADYKWTGYDGTKNYSSTLVVDKQVDIYGAGYANGANSTIIQGGEFAIGKHAAGTTLTGIRFDLSFTLDSVSDCRISRCQMNSKVYLSGKGMKNIHISECQINSSIVTLSLPRFDSKSFNAGEGPEVNFSKCIFLEGGMELYTVTLNNCLIEQLYGSAELYYSSISNCIYVLSHTATNRVFDTAENCSFVHNMWVGGYPDIPAENACTFTSDIDRVEYAGVFVAPDKVNYHLQEGCVGKNAGSDGTDVGIYGTAVPFKESMLPAIPHFAVKVIASETDAAGRLPVNIKIEAQER